MKIDYFALLSACFKYAWHYIWLDSLEFLSPFEKKDMNLPKRKLIISFYK